MPKLNDIDVDLTWKTVDICGIQEAETDSKEENRNRPYKRIFLGRKGNKQLRM